MRRRSAGIIQTELFPRTEKTERLELAQVLWEWNCSFREESDFLGSIMIQKIKMFARTAT